MPKIGLEYPLVHSPHGKPSGIKLTERMGSDPQGMTIPLYPGPMDRAGKRFTDIVDGLIRELPRKHIRTHFW